MKKVRNIDRVPRGRRKPWIQPEQRTWTVVAREVSGAVYEDSFVDEAVALKHSIWRHQHPGIVDVEVKGPAYSGTRHLPTEADIAVGQAMVDVLEARKVCPTVKYKIGLWMDSKAWGGSLDG